MGKSLKKMPEKYQKSKLREMWKYWKSTGKKESYGNVMAKYWKGTENIPGKYEIVIGRYQESFLKIPGKGWKISRIYMVGTGNVLERPGKNLESTLIVLEKYQ